MAGSEVTVQATGQGHPSDRMPVIRRPGAQTEWHLWDCPIALAARAGISPTERCLAHPLKTGCSSAPRPDQQ